MVNPHIKTWKSFLHLNSLIFVLPAFKWFHIVLGKHRKPDVTILFAHSHLNTPIDQGQHTYYLKYFINHNSKEGDKPHPGNWILIFPMSLARSHIIVRLLCIFLWQRSNKLVYISVVKEIVMSSAVMINPKTVAI